MFFRYPFYIPSPSPLPLGGRSANFTLPPFQAGTFSTPPPSRGRLASGPEGTPARRGGGWVCLAHHNLPHPHPHPPLEGRESYRLGPSTERGMMGLRLRHLRYALCAMRFSVQMGRLFVQFKSFQRLWKR